MTEEKQKTYLDKLRESARETGSIACMGLDPVLEAMSKGFTADNLTHFFSDIFEEMLNQRIFPGVFKPNEGFWRRLDRPLEEDYSGSRALTRVIKMSREKFPLIPIILDAKRGDIATSSGNYAADAFDCWQADATTISPYMGSDSVMPFIDRAMKDGRGVYILNRTSNPGAKDLQNLVVPTGMVGVVPITKYLYSIVAEKIVEWGKGKPGVGAVVGATSLEELTNLVIFYVGKDISLLIPGVGKQGGTAPEVMERLRRVEYDLNMVRINSSSGLTHPWKTGDKFPRDYAKVCVEALAKLNQEIGYEAA